MCVKHIRFILYLLFWKWYFGTCRFLKKFCACSCEDVSCARGFENDIMSLLALKILILLFIIYNYEILFKKLKTFDLKMKKSSTSSFTYCWKGFRNWISDSTTSLFFGKLNLKCDCKLIHIPSLFLEIPLQTFRIQPCMYGIPELKSFLHFYSQFENKKSKNENLFAMLAFLSALLSYTFSFEAIILFVNHCICAF